DQHEVDLVEHVSDGALVRRGRQRNACLLADALDELQRSIEMRACLRMHRDDVGTSLRKRLDVRIAGGDHQVDVEDLLRMRPDRFDQLGTERDVRYEMAVHHVDMHPIAACRVDGAHLLAEPREVGRKDRRGDEDVLHAGGRLLWRAVPDSTFGAGGGLSSCYATLPFPGGERVGVRGFPQLLASYPLTRPFGPTSPHGRGEWRRPWRFDRTETTKSARQPIASRCRGGKAVISRSPASLSGWAGRFAREI